MSQREEISVSTADPSFVRDPMHPEKKQKRIGCKVYYTVPETIQEAVEMFNKPENEEDYVFKLFKKAFIIEAQAIARKVLESMGDPDTNPNVQPAMQKALDEWEPGAKVQRTRITRVADPVKQILEDDDMDPSVLEDLIAKMQAKFNQRKAQVDQQLAGTSVETAGEVTQGNGSIVVEEQPEGNPENPTEDEGGDRPRRGRR